MLISIIIPVRNEEKFIARCLDSILANDYPKNDLEIFVIDGMSEDKTRDIVNSYIQKYSFIKLLNNPKKYTPYALNIGVNNSKGKAVIRMDAHASYKKDYISKCLKYLKEYNADVVGGAAKTVPSQNTLTAKAITICLSSFFGAGGAKFRIGSEKIIEADTVFNPCYKKEVFEKFGLFNENLFRSQDLEFHLRIKKKGAKIILAPDIESFYYPKPDFKSFFLHNISDGIWSIYPLKFSKIPFKPRHYLPLVFISVLLISWFLGFFFYSFYQLFSLIVVLYILTSLLFSLEISIRKKNTAFLYLMPIAFACRHFGYGLGSLWGLLTLYGKKKTEGN